jgi:hypothetical protein
MVDEEDVEKQSCDQYIAIFPPFDAPYSVNHLGERSIGNHYRQPDWGQSVNFVQAAQELWNVRSTIQTEEADRW